MRARDRYLVRQDGRLLVHARWWRQVGLATFCGYVGLIGILLVGASIQDLAVSLSPDPLWGLGLGGLLIWLFGKPGVTLARRAMSKEPMVVVDHAGVTFAQNPPVRLTWSEIVDYRTTWSARLTGGALGSIVVRPRVGSPVVVPLPLLPLEAVELLDELDHYRPRTQPLRR
jgi:hypothetical protein